MPKQVVLFVVSLCLMTALSAQELQKRTEQTGPVITPAPGKVPNSNADYQALRNVGIGGDTFTVNTLVLKRDAGVFTFKIGTISFLAPVNGMVTGLVFQGDGGFDYVPPIAMEKRVSIY